MDVRRRRAVNRAFGATRLGLLLAARAGVPLREDVEHGVLVAHPYPARFPAPRASAVTLGDVVLLRVDLAGWPHLLDHESRHSEQWARHLGLLGYPVAYGLASAVSWLRVGSTALANRFEVGAGLVDGGYLQAGAPGPRPRLVWRRVGALSRRSRCRAPR